MPRPRGYDYRRCREACAARGIKPRIARKGVEPSGRLGRHRWTKEAGSDVRRAIRCDFVASAQADAVAGVVPNDVALCFSVGVKPPA